MRLTTKGRYAVTAMLDLAIRAQEKPVNLADISERQGISLSYLEQLFAKLRRDELVVSVRGPGGGYQLSRSSEEIFVAQIIDNFIGAAHGGGILGAMNYMASALVNTPVIPVSIIAFAGGTFFFLFQKMVRNVKRAKPVEIY